MSVLHKVTSTIEGMQIAFESAGKGHPILNRLVTDPLFCLAVRTNLALLYRSGNNDQETVVETIQTVVRQSLAGLTRTGDLSRSYLADENRRQILENSLLKEIIPLFAVDIFRLKRHYEKTVLNAEFPFPEVVRDTTIV